MLKIVVENDNKLVIDGSKRAYLILLRNRRINNPKTSKWKQ